MPNDNLLRQVQVTRPPNKTAFVAASDDERLVLLSTAWIRQTGRLLECNANFVTLQDWKRRVLKEYPNTRFIEDEAQWRAFLESNVGNR